METRVKTLYKKITKAAQYKVLDSDRRQAFE